MKEKSATKQLKMSVFAGIVTIVLTLFTMVGMSFAWFFSNIQSNARQSVSIGVLDVDINNESAAINVSSAYPMSYAHALAMYNSGQLASYTFRVQNTGTVSMQFRLEAIVINDDNYATYIADPTGNVLPLSLQTSFCARVYEVGATDKGNFTGEGDKPFRLFKADGADVTTFKSFFNGLLLEEHAVDGAAVGMTSKTEYVIAANGMLEIEVLPFLASTATLDSAGEGKNVTFAFRAHGLQLGGGAYFSTGELQDALTDAAPKGVTP